MIDRSCESQEHLIVKLYSLLPLIFWQRNMYSKSCMYEHNWLRVYTCHCVNNVQVIQLDHYYEYRISFISQLECQFSFDYLKHFCNRRCVTYVKEPGVIFGKSVQNHCKTFNTNRTCFSRLTIYLIAYSKHSLVNLLDKISFKSSRISNVMNKINEMSR